MFTRFNCTVICWFLVGLIVSKIYLGHFEILAGIMYILYPFFGLFLFGMANDPGTQEAMDNAISFFGSLAFIYILIPVVVSFVFNRMKKE